MKQYITIGSSISIREIIVVSSGSTDKTNSILRKYDQVIEYKESFIPIIENQRRGKSSAVNTILNIYKSNYLILIPADVSINFISINSLLLRISRNKRIGIVSGSPRPNIEKVNSNVLKYALLTIWELHNEALARTSMSNINTHSSGELMIVRRGIVYSIPSDIINDDAYIAISARIKGYMVSYEPQAIVKIEVPSSINDYIIQRKRILEGHKQLEKTTKRSSSNFRYLVKNQFPLALSIVVRKVSSLKLLVGLVVALILEIRVEVENQSHKRNNGISPRFNPIWKRINQYNPDDKL